MVNYSLRVNVFDSKNNLLEDLTSMILWQACFTRYAALIVEQRAIFCPARHKVIEAVLFEVLYQADDAVRLAQLMSLTLCNTVMLSIFLVFYRLNFLYDNLSCSDFMSGKEHIVIEVAINFLGNFILVHDTGESLELQNVSVDLWALSGLFEEDCAT